MSAPTSTGIATNLVLAAGWGAVVAAGDEGSGSGAGAVEHAVSNATPAMQNPIRLRCSQTRMHLPDQNLGGFGRGDALTAGCGEPHGISLRQWARTLECHFTAGDEQVQVRRRGQFDAVAGLHAGTMQGSVLVADGDRGLVAVVGHAGGDGHQAAAQQLVVDLELLVPGGDT